jgi:hypothetical protein
VGRRALIASFVLMVAFSLIAFQNCSDVTFNSEDAALSGDPTEPDGTGGVIPPPPMPTAPPNAVCDPFATGTTSRENGLVADLRYLVMGIHGDTASALNSRTISYYLSDGHKAAGILYFSSLNTPTLHFTAGFQTKSGDYLLNPVNEEPLVEYFALSFHSLLQLAPGEAEGRYQLALISDDGSVLDIKNGDAYSRLVDNDGTHSTRMVCATQTVEMKTGQSLPIQVHYYQGPRTEIALQLLWRPVTEGQSLQDSMCGVVGRTAFFTGFENGGTPQPTSNYTAMLDRGWKVLSNQNFLLPASAGMNPCAMQ